MKVDNLCGICGFLGNESQSVIQKMNDAISYRGPDEKATIYFEKCSFGFSRIRIKGNYRSSNEFCFFNKTIRVIFNGEIYNYHLLKNLLIKSGVIFQTDLELELIAVLFAYYGENFVSKLDGMFAIAIYVDSVLYLYRDKLGIKPLYYALDKKHNFYFASEIKSIFATTSFSPEINTEFLEDSLTFGFSTSKTASPFKDIHQLSPGNYIKLSNNSIIKKCYYIPHITCLRNAHDYASILDNVKSLLENAVHKMFGHDFQNKGICLSGGFDSSMIALLAASESKKKLHTYTLTSGIDANSEDILYASKVAKKIGSDHQLINIDLEEALSNIVHFIYHYESADFGGVFDPNGGLAFHILLGYVSKDVKVAFSGEGADELFCGYGKLHGQPDVLIQKIKKRSSALSKLNSNSAIRVNSFFPDGHNEEFYQRKIYELLLTQGLYNYHLPCVDRSSSSYGTELRPIFLDIDLFEYAKNLKLSLKINQFKTKIVLKDAFSEYLESLELGDIITRKKLAMPTALESLQAGISRKIVETNSKIKLKKGPYDHLFVSAIEKALFDLFYFLFIVKHGGINYGKISLEEIVHEQEFQCMYN